MQSLVIRLSYSAIAAACCGDLNLATQEIIEDLPRLAARIGLTIAITPAGSPCRCQTHRFWFARDDKLKLWRCPVLGCMEFYADAAEEHSEAARIFHQIEHEPRPKKGGGEHKKRRERPKKWYNRQEGENNG